MRNYKKLKEIDQQEINLIEEYEKTENIIKSILLKLNLKKKLRLEDEKKNYNAISKKKEKKI